MNQGPEGVLTSLATTTTWFLVGKQARSCIGIVHQPKLSSSSVECGDGKKKKNSEKSFSEDIHIYMRVCISVCICVCVCYVCEAFSAAFAPARACRDTPVYVCMYICMYMCVYVCMYVCVCMYICMCVCVCMYVCEEFTAEVCTC